MQVAQTKGKQHDFARYPDSVLLCWCGRTIDGHTRAELQEWRGNSEQQPAQPTPRPCYTVSLGSGHSEYLVFNAAGNYLGEDREVTQRILAAAPAMLEALERVLAVFTPYMQAYGSTATGKEVVANAEAALKLARGE